MTTDISKTVTVARYMTRGPHTIGREQSLERARAIMKADRIRHLPVLDGGKLVGVLSDRELGIFEGIAAGAPLLVEDVMVPGGYVTFEDAPLAVVAAEMAELKVGSAVVMKGGHVVGVFTAVDAFRALAEMLGGDGPGARS